MPSQMAKIYKGYSSFSIFYYSLYIMKINKLFFASLAIIATLVGCKDKEEPASASSLSLDRTAVELGKDGESVTISLTSNRDWTATPSAEWIAIDPKSGSASADAQSVIITVLPNTGNDRTGSVTFSIGLATKSIKISQAGEGGSLEDATVYKNDFDKEVAVKGDKGWPYLDQFEGWKNASGTGVGSETYSFSGMSVRSNSTSNSSYSDYAGSGSNNLFFGKSPYFSVQGIALPANTNYTLSFGSEKYSQEGNSLFVHNEFHVYISNDGAKWVELEYAFPNGDKEGMWDLASTTFTVPAGTSSLSIYFAVDAASVYRLDDLSLVISSAAGTEIDFSKGTAIGGGSTVDPDVDYTKTEAKTVAEFIELADNNTYYKLTGTVSGFNSEYCSFDITDATGSAYVYSVANKADWSSKISNGGTVVLAGKYLKYTTEGGTVKNEVVEAQILSFVAGEGGNEGGSEGGNEGGETPDPEDPVTGDGLSVVVKDCTWAEETDGTYGKGVSTTVSGVKIGCYKHKSTNDIKAPGPDQLRIYKNGALCITAPEGKKVASVFITTTGYNSNYGTDYNVALVSVVGGGSSVVNDATTQTWTPSEPAQTIVATSSNGQVRALSFVITLAE